MLSSLFSLSRRPTLPLTLLRSSSSSSSSCTSRSYESFQVSIQDKVAHIQLNRPAALNAMNRAFWNELPQIVQEVSE